VSETIIARYDPTHAILGLLGLIVAFPAIALGWPIHMEGDYATFFENSQRAYGWLVLIAMAPVSIIVGFLLLVDMVRMRGVGVLVRDGELIVSGPWRASIPIAAIERVGVGGRPYGVEISWDGGHSRGFNTLLMRPERAVVCERILGLLAERDSRDM